MTPTKPARSARVDIADHLSWASKKAVNVESAMRSVLADLEATRAELAEARQAREDAERKCATASTWREVAEESAKTLRAECGRLRVELADIDTRERDARGWDLARDNADAQRWRAVERELRSLRCIHDGIKPGCFVCELVAAYRAATDGGGE